MRQRSQDRVEDRIKLFADVLSQEPKHEIAVFLQQPVLAPVAAIGIGVGQGG